MNNRMKMLCVAVVAVALMGLGALTVGADSHTSLKKTFDRPGVGYTIKYPDAWKATFDSGKALFSGAKTEKDIGPAVGIRNVKSAKVEGGVYKDVDELAKDIESQLMSKDLRDVKVYSTEPYAYDKGGVKLSGKQFFAEYAYGGASYRQWFVIVPRADGTMFHLWYFVSNAGAYDKNLVTAKAMIDSWMIQK
jgi:hypothetical protein